MKFSSSLKNLVVDGNPIGPVGLRFLIQAMNQNDKSSFKVHMKEISADKELKTYQNVFDPSNPEKNYSLNLQDRYD